MDAIIDRLAAIEQSAARLIDSAASEKKRLEKQFHAAIARYDAEVDRRTAEKQQALRKEASKPAAGHYLRKLFGETT